MLESLFFAFGAFLGNKESRALLLRPAFKTLQIYILSGVITISLLITYFYVSDFALGFWSLLMAISGSLLVLLLLPFVVAFIYLSFFCDGYYRAIISGIIKGNVQHFSERADTEEKILDKQKKTGILKILLLLFVLFLMLVFSIFLPFVSILLGGFIFGIDIFSQALSSMEVPYGKQISFITQRVLPITIGGTVIVSVSLIPFAILILYPIGVLAAADYSLKIDTAINKN